MPRNSYYGGHGREVMASMKRSYGAKKAERVFYATAAKTAQKPRITLPTPDQQDRANDAADRRQAARTRALNAPVDSRGGRRVLGDRRKTPRYS
jgi:hypothetical protein